MSAWISMKDVPPPFDEFVVLFSPDSIEPQIMIGARNADDPEDFYDDCTRLIDAMPTHWMPLPGKPGAAA